MRVFVFFSVLLISAVLGMPRVSNAQTGPDQASIQKVVNEICSDGGAWRKCYSLEPSKCKPITTGVVEPCVEKVMKVKVDEPGEKTAARLLICFNKEFMAKYSAGEVKTPECRDPMQHLSRKQ